MRWLVLVSALGACVANSAQATGLATLELDGGSPMQLSAWASESNPSMLGGSTDWQYEPWQITLVDAPTGTSCAELPDSSAWIAGIAIAVPYTQGADAAALAQLTVGSMPIADLDAIDPVAQPEASLQIFNAGDEGVMSSGTLTSFDDSALQGTFDAAGTGDATKASGTFTAMRCDI